MIPTGVQVFVALEPIDMRWSFDRLAGAALERIGYDARSGALFIYFGKRRDAVKVLFFDGSGMCVFYKRLDSGVFAYLRPPRSMLGMSSSTRACSTRCSMVSISVKLRSRHAALRACTDARCYVLTRQDGASSGRAMPT